MFYVNPDDLPVGVHQCSTFYQITCWDVHLSEFYGNPFTNIKLMDGKYFPFGYVNLCRRDIHDYPIVFISRSNIFDRDVCHFVIKSDSDICRVSQFHLE